MMMKNKRNSTSQRLSRRVGWAPALAGLAAFVASSIACSQFLGPSVTPDSYNTIRVDGGPPVAFSDSLPAGQGVVEISPDGRQLIGTTREKDFYVSDLDGSHRIMLVEAPDQEKNSPTWSPDGKHIAYLNIGWRNTFPERVPPDYPYAGLYLVNPDGSDLVHLVTATWEQGPIYRMSWSPDSRKIAFTYWISPRGIFVIDIGCLSQTAGCDKAVRPLTDEVYNPWFVWSTDGQWLAFDDVSEVIWVINLACLDQPTGCLNAKVRLTPEGKSASGPAWSPDGKWIVFQSSSDGHINDDLYMIDRDGGNLQVLANTGDTEFCPAWSPDGEWIAYLVVDSSNHLNSFIYVVHPDGTGRKELQASQRIGGCLNWLNDGRILFYVQR